MTATYSSFDTLTIGVCEGFSGSPDGKLPVLAEIPLIGPMRQPLKEAARYEIDQAHASQQAPHFETTAPPTPISPVAQPQAAVKEEVHTQTAEQSDWAEGPWSARLLEIEAQVRPHARLVVLIALILLTGLTLALMRAPVAELPQAPPSDVVDAPRSAPVLENKKDSPQLVSVERDLSAVEASGGLEPIPALPQVQVPAKATIVAFGPTESPVANWPDITPLEAAAPGATSGGRVAHSEPATGTDSPLRFAKRAQYPTTNAPQESWLPSAESTQTLKQTPAGRMLPPTNQ